MTDPARQGALSAGDRARMLRKALAGAGPPPGAPATGPRRAPRPASAPASYAQEQLWFLDQLLPGNANYNVPFVFEIDGPVDVPALRAALGATTVRHDSLRTALRAGPDGLTQAVSPTVELPLTVVDVSGTPDPEGEARRRGHALAARPVPLDRAPLWRALLLRVSGVRYRLVWVASHAMADGWSVGLLLRELMAGYRVARHGGPDDRPEPLLQFTEYASRQREALTTDRIAGLVEFWRGELGDCPVLDFPSDHPRPELASTRGATHTFPIPDQVVRSVRDTARQLGVTPFHILLAAYHALLARYCASTDVAVGTPVAGRETAECDDLMGSLVNTVVVRMNCPDDPTFATFAARTAAVTARALAHQELPFGLLVEHLRPRRDGRYNPVCQTVFSFGSTPHTDHEYVFDGGVRVRSTGISNGTVRFDLELAVDDEPGGWTGRLEHSTDLVSAASAERLCDRYLRLLTEALGDPERRLSRLLLPSAPAPPPTPDAPAGTPPHRESAGSQWLVAALAAWFARRPDRAALPESDPLALCGRSGLGPDHLPPMYAAARQLAGEMGLDAGCTLDWERPPDRIRLLFAALLGVAADSAGGPAPGGGAGTAEAWLVRDTASATAPGPGSRVLVLDDHPAPVPAALVPAAASVWQVTLAPDVPGALLAHRVRCDEDRLVLGRPLPGTRAELVDAAGGPALRGAVGRLALTPPGAATAPGGAPRPGWRVHELDDGLLATPGRAFELRGPAADTGPRAVDQALVDYLLGMWREALGVPVVQPDDDFFELGGHSLLAGELVTRIREGLGCEFALVEFFQTLTVREVASLLSGRVVGVPDAAGAGPIPPDLLARVEEMTDEEVARLLQRVSIKR